MNRFLSGGAAALIALVVGSAAASAQTKIGYVNSQKVLAEAPAAQTAQHALEADMTRYRAQIDSIEKSFEAQRTAFEGQQATLSATVKAQRQADLQTRYAAAQTRVQQIQETAQRRQAELVEPVMKRINEIIEALRKEQNIGLVLDASSAGILAADPALDLTDQVIARVKAAAPAAAAPASH
ncbi:MAG: outer rane chaperone Skp (OmpH) family protein [Gemmatimonadetes bacterium]|nr:outer rane chaperone Skp (OmpH) family protein [Gemmatimonadota bacterium]